MNRLSVTLRNRFPALVPMTGLCLLIHLNTPGAEAQDNSVVELETTSAEGVAGTIDKKRRGPLVSVQQVHRPDRVTILVDATHPRDDLKPYPIQLDYYVNRHLFTSQVRSPELPGALGVDIGADVATPPFNFTVVAKVLHPNSTWTTVVQGAAEPQQFDNGNDDVASSGVYDCDLTRGEDSALGESIAITKGGTNTYAFTISDSTSENLSSTGVALTVSGTTGSATLTFNDAESSEVSGSVLYDSNGNITELDLTNEDGEAELFCSHATQEDDSETDANDSSESERTTELERLFKL
jgi:hypothetical protein